MKRRNRERVIVMCLQNFGGNKTAMVVPSKTFFHSFRVNV